MDDTRNETRDLSDDELVKSIETCLHQVDKIPHLAALLVVFSGHDVEGNALMCGHSLNNPTTVAAALVNEATIFGRQSEVLSFIRATRAILDTAELNIEHYTRIQSKNN